MDIKLKDRILNNTFIDKIRTQLDIDELEYDKLSESLQELATTWRESILIDKELALVLYSMPVIVRNAYLSFSNHDPVPEIVNRLEDIWIELDELVTDCFSG